MYGVHGRVIVNGRGRIAFWYILQGTSPPPFMCGSVHRTHQDRKSAAVIQNGDPHNVKYAL
jgi:hypothetical protein